MNVELDIGSPDHGANMTWVLFPPEERLLEHDSIAEHLLGLLWFVGFEVNFDLIMS